MEKLLKGMVLDGIFASEAVDTSGEVLDVAGCDISTLEEGLGVINYEHQGTTPEDVLGKVLSAKKIFGPGDCSDDRQLLYWNRVGLPFIYGQAELFDSEGHPGARAAAAIVRYYHARGEPLLARWSIEGTTMEREGNELRRSVAKNVALTLKPCNRSCSSGLIEEAHVVSDGQPGVAKSEAGSRFLRKGEFSDCAGVVDDPFSETVEARLSLAMDRLRGLAALAKTITAAGAAAMAPGMLTGGAALQVEHVERKGQVLSALRDWDRATPIRRFLKHRMPEASDDYIDLFAGLVDDFEMRKAEGLFDNLRDALSKGTGAGQVVAESKPAGKRRTFVSVGGHRIEGSIADAGHGNRIRQQLADKGYADLTLYRGIGRPGGRKSGVKVLPTAMSSDVRYYTLSRPQAEAVVHWKSGTVTGETRKYGARVRNPLVVEGLEDEGKLWRDVGEHIASKHRYRHSTGYGRAGLLIAHGDRLAPNHPAKTGPRTDTNPNLRSGAGIDWSPVGGGYGGFPGERGLLSASAKQFLGEYLRDNGHDAAVFLSKRGEGGGLGIPSDGMSQVVIPHAEGYWPDADDGLRKAEKPELAAQLRERGKPRRFELDGEHGAEGAREALPDGDYVVWHRHDDGRERPVFRFLSRGGEVTHLEDHTGGRASAHVPEGPMAQESHAALEGLLSGGGHVLEKMDEGDEEDKELEEAKREPKGMADGGEATYEFDDGSGSRYYRLVDDRLVDEDGEPLTDDETEDLLYAVESGMASMRETPPPEPGQAEGDGDAE